MSSFKIHEVNPNIRPFFCFTGFGDKTVIGRCSVYIENQRLSLQAAVASEYVLTAEV